MAEHFDSDETDSAETNGNCSDQSYFYKQSRLDSKESIPMVLHRTEG